jgi:coenzyme F420-reducing hydrogenase gamma subunit
VEGVGDEIPVYPGIDVDLPSGECPTTPERVRDAVVAAFRGGARGVSLSRKYSEMRLANLSGAGAALRELGYA